ncbi:nitroreductase family protein [Clostridium sp. AWRP]|uniref:nitroreductase family protein n=1 Tax=Clostridium sp. AWRP TaxID=2212991 RepID=UPI000FD71E70|nr:nitroreductase family protein [Clostridium sp. AWRP]AZV58355.1 nitroreductase [Clostridium sp. AWRP]
MSIEAIYNRRSIRKYKSKEIPIDIINKILESGRAAPSGKNRQPWKFIVFGGIRKEELLSKMDAGIQRELNEEALLPNSRDGIPDAKNTLRIMKEASIIIMVFNTNGKSPFKNITTADERFTEIVDTLSIGAAIENMLLQAEDLGVGTLWIANTCFAYDELVNYIDVKTQLVGAVALGYPDEKPNPRPRKTPDSIIEYRL